MSVSATTTELSHPAAIHDMLERLDEELMKRQNDVEQAAMEWFFAKRERERKHAEVFIGTEGTVSQREAAATLATWDLGRVAEGRYEALKAGIRVRETRVGIAQSLLKSMGRA